MDKNAYDELVTLDPYDLSWPGRYRRERGRLARALGELAVAYEHFGSSAVPGLASKPIVDILVGAASGEQMQRLADAVVDIGYEVHDIADTRRVYATRRDGEHAFNLAICRYGGEVWCDNLLLRDHLRAQEGARSLYETAKRDALASGDDRRVAYSRAKQDAAGALLAEARATIDAQHAAFAVLFGGLDRLGPGAEAATRHALEVCKLAPTTSGAFGTLDLDSVDRPLRVADLGCGTGAATLVLAGELDVPVLAIDQDPRWLCELEARAAAAGLGDTVDVRRGDIGALDTDLELDVIWAEGSAWTIGFDRAIEQWSQRLADGGTLAVTECCWATDEPPDAATTYWRAAYPQMRRVADVLASLATSGLVVLEHFTLPRDAWVAYYQPLRQRVAALLDGDHATPALRAVAEAMRDEIAMWDAHGEAWRYEFFVLRRPD